MRETGLIAIILVLFIVMTFASPYFLTWVNMRAMVMAFAIEGIVVIGMTILLISGEIDLSVGSVTALSTVVAGWLFLAGIDPWVASAIAIAVCTGIGAVMGYFVTRVGSVRDVFDIARKADIALLGIGSIQAAGSSYYDLNPVPEADRKMLASSGVVAELLAHLIRDDGAVADYPLNNRLVALDRRPSLRPVNGSY
ncbi:sugar-binding domain-containing protein [Pseudophaeobacter leonis]|uniref:sugar-binding domain-containing protein n=1 Tax=Pseudophaeobacter leonis TaxID=1144477 RepID=UPI0009F716A9|nr:sugar-binding domain-containing protein [Pseudophaeobacter leonis]